MKIDKLWISTILLTFFASSLTTGAVWMLIINPAINKSSDKVNIIKNPELLQLAIEKINNIENKKELINQKKFIKNNKEKLFNDSNLHYRGEKYGLIVAEFIDYNCLVCKKAFQDLSSAEADGRPLQMIVHHAPILSNVSMIAAKAAIAAKMQGKFEKIHSVFMNSHSLTKEMIFKIMENARLDMPKAKADMESKKVKLIIDSDLALFSSSNSSGTPLFISSKKIFRGYNRAEISKELNISFQN